MSLCIRRHTTSDDDRWIFQQSIEKLWSCIKNGDARLCKSCYVDGITSVVALRDTSQNGQ